MVVAGKHDPRQVEDAVERAIVNIQANNMDKVGISHCYYSTKQRDIMESCTRTIDNIVQLYVNIWTFRNIYLVTIIGVCILTN